MPNNTVLYLILFCSLLSSCDKNQVFDKYKTTNNAWHKDNTISFDLNMPDTTSAYNLFVNVRNTNEYKYSNLFLIVAMNFPNGKVLTDTLEYKMAEPSGKLLGSGFSKIKENKLWYKENVVFNEAGTYKVDIQQAMRKNGDVNGIESLEGITDVGFRVETPQINK